MVRNAVETIKADAKSVRQILDKSKYEIDIFQREYKWERKQIEQLVADLAAKFLSDFEDSHEREEVKNYSNYYLGSIILSLKEGSYPSIIDGQQRLTSLTLLLIYLNNLQSSRSDKVPISDLIFSEKYSKKSYNIQIDDRKDCIDALYNDKKFDPNGKGESVKNIVERYRDLDEVFPPELKEKALALHRLCLCS